MESQLSDLVAQEQQLRADPGQSDIERDMLPIKLQHIAAVQADVKHRLSAARAQLNASKGWLSFW